MRMEANMKITEHLLFLALMIPSIVLLILAAVSLAQPAHPSTVMTPQSVLAGQATASPVDERWYEGTY